MADAPAFCYKCKQSLNDSQTETVVAFGSNLYHVLCRCAKCQNLVEHEANLLLLSDGSPVCENCSYNCSLCHLAITNEAIVTGDESYHAECFKCRSCENRIEELVFAKTSQGIYCMTCHNERVSRSRRHAEAKKNRSKPSSSKPSSNTRSNTVNTTNRSRPVGTTSPQPPSTADVFSAVPSTANSILDNDQISNSPPSTLSTYPKPAPLNPITTPKRSDSIAKTESNREPESPTALHIRVSHSSNESQKESTVSTRPKSPLPGLQQRPNTSNGVYDASTSTEGQLPSGSYESTPQLDNLSSLSAPATNTGFAPSANGFANKRHSLMAPTKSEKASNRRSGFYGAPLVPANSNRSQTSPLKEEEDSPNRVVQAQHAQAVNLATPPLSPSLQSAPSTPTVDRMTTPPRSAQPDNVPIVSSHLKGLVPTSPDGPDISRSLSFYDPDMLALLDIPATPDVPKTPQIDNLSPYLNGFSPKLDGMDGFRATSDDDMTARLASEDALTPDGVEPEDDDVLTDMQKLRQSLKPAPDGEALNLDVSLIDNLITELEETRSKMKDLQREFNAMRRASSHYLEGMVNVRDSYEREAILRRQAETEMSTLRSRIHEQAKKLLALNTAKKEEDDLEARSSELRTSVYGMEQKLSSLQVERDITVAEIEQLTHPFDKTDASTPEKTAASLKSRLDAVKDEHRQELIDLASQRDAISREISDLMRQRDYLTEENVILEARGLELNNQNKDALKQLDSLREATTIQRQPFNISLKGHQKTHGLASSGSSGGFDAAPEASNLIQAARIETTQPAVKKFKWGKGKPAEAKATSSNSSQKNGQIGAGRPSGSSDIAVRHHLFQPTSILRPVRCEHCTDKMWGLQELRCAACGLYCHTKCAPYYHIQCNSAASTNLDEQPATGNSLFGNDLLRQIELENRSVPNIVSACIAAVEAHGMDFEGIYRKTGGMSQVKQITHAFETSDTFSPLEGNFDISAVTSVLKNYFRTLENPLYTYQLHDELIGVVEANTSESRRVEALDQVLAKLPAAHHATLRLLMNHLHRIHLQSEINKMTPANLGVVFSPTLLRSGVAGQEFNDINHRAKVVELCVEYAPRLFA